MKYPLVIDGRNCYDLDKVKNNGIIYESIGRITIYGLDSENSNLQYRDEAAASICK
jgi:UDPglucose 6-dehydrogenase